jgi:hypothetical protein
VVIRFPTPHNASQVSNPTDMPFIKALKERS